MAMTVKQDGGDDDAPMSEINTTPLVDVMLVLLIIFLITIPVVKQTQQYEPPKVANIETASKPENIEIVVTANGEYYQGLSKYESPAQLKAYILTRAVEVPQPEVHIMGDRNARFEAIGRAMYAVQQGGIVKVAFITEPPPRGQ